MKKQLFLLSSLCLVFVACDNTTSTGYKPSHEKILPGDQGETEEDRTIVQKIREALSKDRNFTSETKNIKIHTANGVVTLRGTVISAHDKNELGKKAKETHGVKNVDNQVEIVALEITPTP